MSRSPLGPTAVVLSCLVASGCSSPDRTTTDPEPVAPTSSASPSPTPVESPEPADPGLVAPDWTSAQYAGLPVELWRLGRGFVGATTYTVVGLEADGTERWKRRAPKGAYVMAHLLDDVLVIEEGVPGTDGVYPSPEVVSALDARTGEELWSTDSNFMATDDDRVYVATCSGAETSTLGDCTLSARDPGTGAVLWATAAYDNIEQLEVAGRYLVAQTFPAGTFSIYQAFDRTTGSLPGLGVQGRGAAVVPGVIVAPGEDDTRPADGCTYPLRGVTPEGHVLWRRTLDLPLEKRRSKKAKPRCDEGSVWAEQSSGMVTVSPGLHATNRLLDPRTGRMRPVGGRGDLVQAVTRRYAVLRDGTITARAIDLRTGRTAWTDPGGGAGWQVVSGGRVAHIRCDPRCDTIVRTLATGRVLRSAEGEFITLSRTGRREWLGLGLEDSKRYRGRFAYVDLGPVGDAS